MVDCRVYAEAELRFHAVGFSIILDSMSFSSVMTISVQFIFQFIVTATFKMKKEKKESINY